MHQYVANRNVYSNKCTKRQIQKRQPRCRGSSVMSLLKYMIHIIIFNTLSRCHSCYGAQYYITPSLKTTWSAFHQTRTTHSLGPLLTNSYMYVEGNHHWTGRITSTGGMSDNKRCKFYHHQTNCHHWTNYCPDYETQSQQRFHWVPSMCWRERPVYSNQTQTDRH